MVHRRINQLVGTACLLALSVGSAALMAQSDKASAADKKFVKEAMQGGMAEVELGQLASQKAQSADVKQFGQKMVDDHTKLNEQMKTVASHLGIAPPGSLDMKHKAICLTSSLWVRDSRAACWRSGSPPNWTPAF